MNAYQEPKYEVGSDGELINRQSGEAIPDDEPVFVFRARDIHAAAVLIYYSTLAKDEKHREAIRMRAAQFSNWAVMHRARMKEPDTQMDKGWSAAGVPNP